MTSTDRGTDRAVERGAGPGAPAEVRARAREATLECIARFGLAKLTVDDIARAAGCSRATLYRAYPSKRALIDAAVAADADHLVARLCAVGASAPSLADAVTDVIVVGARELQAHPALGFVAHHEAELLHPHLSFAGGSQFLRSAAARLAPAFVGHAPDPERVAEWSVRLGLALVWFPHPPVDVADRDAVHALVATFVAPGLAAAAPSPAPHPQPEED